MIFTLLSITTTLVWSSTPHGWRDTAPLGPDPEGYWDVIVVGSEPEGVAAAVAAAETGARTLLISEDHQVGGLFVLGQMNVLDLRTQPFDYQQGFFERWWQTVGRAHAFDVKRAEAAFTRFLRDARVTIRLNADPIEPVMNGARVSGVRSGKVTHYSRQVIDATANMSFAAEAGAAYTLGFASLGLEERMADTLVFRIEGVDWQLLSDGIRKRGAAYAAVDDRVAWGHFGGYPAAYEAQEEGVRLRGLNLGRQDDGSILVNALLIYGINPFDPDSVADGVARATREAPRIVTYLTRELPGFKRARLAGVAPQLYTREARHLQALCIITAGDLLDNRVTAHDVAAGGYPMDVQTLTPADNGYVFGISDIYGVPLCVTVPEGLDGIWVVGKSAGYDPIAASSARVVPFGMTIGEAVGVAAAQAAREQQLPRDLVTDSEAIAAVRRELTRRGAYLPTVANREPVGPHQHPHYRAYRLLLSRGLAVGGYDNDPRLDEPMQAISYIYTLSNVATRFHGPSALGQKLLARFQDVHGYLTPGLALEITRAALCEVSGCSAEELGADRLRNLLSGDLELDSPLTRGEMYELAAMVASVEPGPELDEKRTSIE